MDHQDAKPSGPEPKPGRRRIVWGTALAFVVLAGLAIYAAVHQGVNTIDFTHGTISFNHQMGASQIQQKQPALQAQASAAVSLARSQASPSSSGSDFSGQWVSNFGLTYVITQFGDQAAVQERSQYGITAVGEGTVTGNSATFNFRALDGSTGRAFFQLADTSTIRAHFENDTYSTSSDAVLTR